MQDSSSLHPNSNMELSDHSWRTVKSFKGFRTFRRACLRQVLWRKLTWKIHGIVFIGKVYEVLDVWRTFDGTWSGCWHVAAKRMPLKEWLEMAQSSSSWQACFYRAPALIGSGHWLGSESCGAGLLAPLQEEGTLGFLVWSLGLRIRIWETYFSC